MGDDSCKGLAETISSFGKSLREMPLDLVLDAYFLPEDYTRTRREGENRLITLLEFPDPLEWINRQSNTNLGTFIYDGRNFVLGIVPETKLMVELEYTGEKKEDLYFKDYSKITINSGAMEMEYFNPRGLLGGEGSGVVVKMTYL